MTPDLATRLRDYCDYLEELAPAVHVDEILVEPVVPELGLRPRRQARWVYAVVAAVATGLLIGVFGLAVSLIGNESEVIDSPPTVVTTVPATTPTTVGALTTIPPPAPAAPIVAFAARGWQRDDIPPDAFGNERFLHLNEIVEWNGRLYLVGTTADERRQPVIWASDDGLEWTRTFVGTGEDNMMAVIPGGSGLVAVGGHRDVAPTPVWVSEDGVTWVESRYDMPDMKDITAMDERLFAVASVWQEPISEERQFNDPPLYFSDDGVTWTGIPRMNFEPAQNGKLWELHAVVSGDGGLVAYGEIAVDDTGPSEADTNYRPDAGFWASEDGTTWTLAGVPSHLTGGVGGGLQGNGWLAGGPDGYVAYRHLSERIVDGRVVPASEMVLFSQDGSQWEIGLELSEDMGMRITAVAATPEGFVATGVASGGLREAGVIWTSPDGVTWTLVSEDLSMFENVAIDGVWPTATGLIALGHVGIPCAEKPQLPDCPPVILTWSPGGE